MDNQFDILGKAREFILEDDYLISDIKPSEWAEKHRVMTTDVSNFPGQFDYDRTPYLREIVDCLMPSHPAREVAIMKGAQLGFALSVDTPIPTPKGFTLMGQLKKGDKVFDEKGRPCNVIKATDVMFNHKCYEVTFTDNTTITCDHEHLWTVFDNTNDKNLKGVRTIDTEEIANTFRYGNRNRYHIPNAKPLDLPEKELLIDPYLLGVWLGDGAAKSNVISGLKEDLEFYQEEFKRRGIHSRVESIPNERNTHLLHVAKPKKECLRGHVYNEQSIKRGSCIECKRQIERKNTTPDPIIYPRFAAELKKIGVYRNKMIPTQYLRGSYQQRLDLLKGLLDTDAHIDCRSRATLTTVSPYLAIQVFELVSSLGYRPTFVKSSEERTVIIKGVECNGKRTYRISFACMDDVNPFLLPRKAKKVQAYRTKNKTRKRTIKNVRLVPSVPVKCITVDSQSNLYLAGIQMVPTHNSTGVLENGIGWIIKENPANVLLAARDEGLVKKMMDKKIDQMIESCGLRHLIRPNVIRARNQRTGDTSMVKEFSGGGLEAFSIQKPEKMRQVSMKVGFLDDFEAAPVSKDAGDAASLFRTRFKSFGDSKKIFWISTPETKQTSNILPLYEQGDQRKYYVPCPCCGDYITLEWKTTGTNGRRAGIVYELDDDGDLISGSVNYKCQSCGEKFNEGHKYEMNLAGEWRPTVKQKDPTFFSYHLSALYAPPGMDDWEAYVKEYLQACPPNGRINIPKYKTFVNTGLGETWEERGHAPKVNRLAMNTREYEIGTVPHSLSEEEGNGKIVMVTCCCDLNGKIEDARLDYEIVAWAESGASYSIDHGSIGTFVPLENEKEKKGKPVDKERERWTYELNMPNNVWDVFAEIITKEYPADVDGFGYGVSAVGIDTGHFTNFCYDFIDIANTTLGVYTIGLKGKGSNNYRKLDASTKIYSPSKERGHLFLLEVNQLKDELAALMNLRWVEASEAPQPNGFMNFPTPEQHKYTMKGYFSQFESEHKILKNDSQGKEIGYLWVKRNNKVLNHFWDVKLYNMATKEICTDVFCKELGIKEPNWAAYCNHITG